MKVRFYLFIAFILMTFMVQAAPNKSAVLLEADGAVGPAMQDYIHKGIEHAVSQKAELILLRLNTPGGLVATMQDIVKDILASPVPIITYVAPQGSRAASAGTYIVYASHIAAMAPATHLGAATPVHLDVLGTKEKASKETTPEERKVLNDSIAYIKGLAHLRNRNADWAEKAVKEGASLGSDEALQQNIIDIVAKDIPDLLKQLNGRTVNVQDHLKVIHTEGIKVEAWQPNWRNQFLSIITDPMIAYLLLIIGIWGIFFEFMNPGYVLPGVAGLIALLIALYAFQLLPIHFIGLALTIVGIAFIAAEFFVTSHGVLGIGGIIAFFIGSILLFDMQGYSTPWTLIISMTLTTICFFLIMIWLALSVRNRKIVSGFEALVGMTAIVQEDFETQGWVKVDGEIWKALSSVPLKKGQKVEVVQSKGLTLIVKQTNNKGK